MRMKSIISRALTFVLVTAPVCTALVLTPNGDYEGDTFTGNGGQIMPEEWNGWANSLDGWGAPSSFYWETDGSNGYVVANVDAGPGATAGGFAVIFSEPRLDLEVIGIPTGTTITLSADIIDLVAGGGGGGAILKVEAWAGTTKLNELEVPISGITDSWENYSMNFTIPVGTEEITAVVGTSTGWGGPNPAESSYGFDNVKLGTIPGRALYPQPIVDAAVPTTLEELRWTSPDPNNPGDTISCEVFFKEYHDPNLFNPNDLISIASGVTSESVNLTTEGIALQSEMYYFWRVNCTDPVLGTTEGFVWTFNTGDVPPDPNAGADQYVWLEGGSVTFTLNGTVKDDGKSPVTTNWSLNYSETDPATTVTIDTPSALTTTVTIDNTGWFEFLLEADDATGHGEDTMNVGVYSSPCEAAKEDLTDRYNNYPGGFNGDVDGDCDTDLHDLAILALSWLDCMSEKLPCWSL